jgi:putative redox protein
MAGAALSLEWDGELRFKSGADSPPIELHSSTPGVTSPTQALAYAAMACMAMDVVHMLTKGRHDVRALSVKFEGERAPDPPRRYVAMRFHFDVTGAVPDAAVQRAIDLSRTTYCSVSNSLRQDIDVKTTFTVRA